MKLRTNHVYIFYDFPVVFLAANEEGDNFICLFVKEEDSSLKYICKQISDFTLMILENNQTDIRSIFTCAGTIYCFCLNAQSGAPFEAIKTTEDITPFLPEKGMFIGMQDDNSLSLQVSS